MCRVTFPEQAVYWQLTPIQSNTKSHSPHNHYARVLERSTLLGLRLAFHCMAITKFIALLLFINYTLKLLKCVQVCGYLARFGSELGTKEDCMKWTKVWDRSDLASTYVLCLPSVLST